LTARQIDSLAGKYTLTVVGTRGISGDATVRGSLELWAADSAYAYGGLRTTDVRQFPLVGVSDIDLRRLAPVTLAYPPSSRDRQQPGVEVQHDGEIWFGNAFGGDGPSLDAGVVFDRVRITSTGFRGEWREGGLRVVNGQPPSGYFCAVRVPS
jgi:hypothetical protein